MQIVVDGLLTHYEKTGTGKQIVLLHGWGDRANGLKSLYTALADYYEVVIPDLPGFGSTQAPPKVWGLQNYAEFIAHFLHKCEVDRVYAFVAHSNGGAIALRGLSNGTLKSEKLVLLASSGIRDTYKGRLKALRIITKAGKVLATPLPKNVKQKLRRKVYQSIGSDMLVVEHLQDTFKKIVTDDVQQDAHKLSQPTLLIYGEADQAAPVRYGERFHELIEGSTLEVLPGAKHFVHLDRPQQVVNNIKAFLQ